MRWNPTLFTPSTGRRTALALGIAAAVIVGTAAAMSASSESPTTPAALDEAAVVAIFDLANTADIETGSLAALRAENKEVRDYGRMLADVHTAVRKQGRDLATKLGVTPVLPAGDKSAQDHAAVLSKLAALKGTEFDRAFLEHEQAFHAAVLSAVKTALLPAIKNQELKDFVVTLAPAFESHRVMAEHLKTKVGGK